MIGRRMPVRLVVLLLAGAALLAEIDPRPVLGQPAPSGLSPADSAAVAAAWAASDSAAAALIRLQAGDPDRFEFGVAAPEDYFDWLGTIAYRRRVSRDARFDHSLHIELAGGHKDYLTEGAASVYWFASPRKLLRGTGRIRPILEAGFGGHLVVQFADIVGFDDWASHARAFAKMHGVAGLEADLSERWGVALRGRLTIPSHRPLDYAQLVLFFK